MPTHSEEETFWRDYARLTREQRIAFAVAVQHMVADLRAGRGFRKGLGIKGVRKHPGVYEMRWADDGRATFTYGLSPASRRHAHHLAPHWQSRHPAESLKWLGDIAPCTGGS